MPHTNITPLGCSHAAMAASMRARFHPVMGELPGLVDVGGCTGIPELSCHEGQIVDVDRHLAKTGKLPGQSRLTRARVAGNQIRPHHATLSGPCRPFHSPNPPVTVTQTITAARMIRAYDLRHVRARDHWFCQVTAPSFFGHALIRFE
jgi:hypothetical protein